MRHKYLLDLTGYLPVDIAVPALTWQALSKSHQAALAELMLAAYRGTIDDDGETLDDAIAEVTRYFAGRPVLECSWLYFDGTQLAAACLVAQEQEIAWISYSMTHPDYKNRGLGYALLHKSLQALAQHGFGQVQAAITENNYPSEAIFRKAGFSVYPGYKRE